MSNRLRNVPLECASSEDAMNSVLVDFIKHVMADKLVSKKAAIAYCADRFDPKGRLAVRAYDTGLELGTPDAKGYSFVIEPAQVFTVDLDRALDVTRQELERDEPSLSVALLLSHLAEYGECNTLIVWRLFRVEMTDGSDSDAPDLAMAFCAVGRASLADVPGQLSAMHMQAGTFLCSGLAYLLAQHIIEYTGDMES